MRQLALPAFEPVRTGPSLDRFVGDAKRPRPQSAGQQDGQLRSRPPRRPWPVWNRGRRGAESERDAAPSPEPLVWLEGVDAVRESTPSQPVGWPDGADADVESTPSRPVVWLEGVDAVGESTPSQPVGWLEGVDAVGESTPSQP